VLFFCKIVKKHKKQKCHKASCLYWQQGVGRRG